MLRGRLKRAVAGSVMAQWHWPERRPSDGQNGLDAEAGCKHPGSRALGEGLIDTGTASSSARLQELVTEHGRTVMAVLVGLERDPAVREELWSDVFTLAYRRIDDLDPLTAQQRRRWLLRAARNLSANTMRRTISRRRAFERLSREPVHVALSAEDAYFATINLRAHDDRIADVHEAWRSLSAAHREVLALDALGHKGPVIAERLGVSHQAARSRLMRARQALLDAYAEVGGGRG